MSNNPEPARLHRDGSQEKRIWLVLKENKPNDQYLHNSL